MIHRDISIIDLYPATWRNLGALFAIDEWAVRRPTSDQALVTILHDRGRLLKIDAPTTVTLPADLSETPIRDSAALAEAIYRANPTLDAVQIFALESLRGYSHTVQQFDWHTLASAAFYQQAFAVALRDPDGLCYYPPNRAPFYRKQRLIEAITMLAAQTADGETLVVGIYDHGRPYFTLIAQVRGGLITLCTTFEHLIGQGIDPAICPAGPQDVDLVQRAVETMLGRVAFCWFGERAAAEAWINSR